MTRLKDFLRAIAAVPQDEPLRLVFADWLEEQGDARAAEVRQTIGRRPYGLGIWSNYTLGSKDKSQLPEGLLKAIADCNAAEEADWVNAADFNVWVYSEAWPLFGKGFALWFGIDLRKEVPGGPYA